MTGTLSDGSVKIDLAKRVLTDHMRSFRPETNIGLRAFGHRLPYQQTAESCQDIELIAPVQKGQMERIVGWLQDFTAQGMTPLAASLQQAKNDFIYEAPRVNSIVMLSDGIETCEGDPCKLVEDLKAQGINFTIHVIGLDVDDPTRQQLKCIAKAGGGMYHDANSQQALNEALGAVKADTTKDEIVVPPGVDTPTPAPPTDTPQPPTPIPAPAGLAPGTIVFASNRDHGNPTGGQQSQSPHEIYVMNADGSDQKAFTTSFGASNMIDMAVSPDRSQILVSNSVLRVLSVSDPNQMQKLTNAISVAWSPDGNQIAYTASTPSGLDVMVMNADGSNVQNLTNDASSDWFLDWSPLGMLAYVHDNGLSIMNPDGSQKRQLIDGFARNLAWSPDGSMIAFERGLTADDDNMFENMDIWIVNSDGSNLRNLTNTTGVFDGNPTWSPDAKYIAFDSSQLYDPHADLQINRMEVASGEVTQLTSQGNNMVPIWVK